MSASINFPGQYQILSEWCWLTCASGVMNYYLGAQAALPYTQCKLAVQENLGSQCCTQTIGGVSKDISTWVPLISAGGSPLHYGSSNCNSPGDPTYAINGTKKVTATWGQPVKDPTWMATELTNKHPVVGHITWDNNGGGHIIVFYGVSQVGSDTHYNVANPWTGNEVWINGYVAGGSWDYSASTAKK